MKDHLNIFIVTDNPRCSKSSEVAIGMMVYIYDTISFEYSIGMRAMTLVFVEDV